eukprot:UN26420
MKHIYERKYCEYMGRRQNELHNLQRHQEKLKLQKKLLKTKLHPIISEDIRGVKKTKGNQSQVGKVKRMVYKPNTSQEEIEAILRRKNVKLKTRGLPQTQISVNKAVRKNTQDSSKPTQDVPKILFCDVKRFFVF